jgi:hypothetical protein
MYDRPLPLAQEDATELHPEQNPELELVRARLAGTIATTSWSSASPVRSISTRGASAPDEGGHPVH